MDKNPLRAFKTSRHTASFVLPVALEACVWTSTATWNYEEHHLILLSCFRTTNILSTKYFESFSGRRKWRPQPDLRLVIKLERYFRVWKKGLSTLSVSRQILPMTPLVVVLRRRFSALFGEWDPMDRFYFELMVNLPDSVLCSHWTPIPLILDWDSPHLYLQS